MSGHRTSRPVLPMVITGKRIEKPLLTVSQAAELAGISRSVAYSWARAGLLAGCVELGGRYYVRAAPFLRWLDGTDEANATPPDDELASAPQCRPRPGPGNAAPGQGVGSGAARGHAPRPVPRV